MKTYKEVAIAMREVEKRLNIMIDEACKRDEDAFELEEFCEHVSDLAFGLETGNFEDCELDEALAIIEDWDL